MTFNMTRPLRIVTLDDHAILLRGLNDILNHEPGFSVVGSFENSRSLLMALTTADADMLVMDYTLSPDDMDGLNLLKTLQTRFPELVVLVVSALYNSATVALALRSGAKGFIGKNMPVEEFIQAIRVAASGRIYIEPEMALQLAQLQNSTLQVDDRGSHKAEKVRQVLKLSVLSPKEQEVIRCFMEGMTVTEIAAKFSRSIKTISGQKQTALRKLGLKADHELFLIKDELQ
ncbi:TPA: response regulator transcription factor [Enterobacter soli]|uniref:response regulator transcription factor n=1 Tax=Enterobacter quasiroggenkampii TaxID=2497436 RepID=UPI002003A528|nr:response regulator transcription factor [Enterobacter quasiroggenkampii]MCK7310588.1 response regulator transcription factor [Enterobacter quasiroggenkampii]HDX4048302.1 response regulator transcription factor [Enterobacter soli]